MDFVKILVVFITYKNFQCPIKVIKIQIIKIASIFLLLFHHIKILLYLMND